MKKTETPIHHLLNELIRQGAERLLTETVEIEMDEWLSQYEHLKDSQGRQRIVRNGYLPKRTIHTPIGILEIQVPRSRDREQGTTPERIQFASKILPPYLRRLNCRAESIAWLYLKGVSAGDYTQALGTLLGSMATGLSENVVLRLRQKWRTAADSWHTRNLSGKDYATVWADAVYWNGWKHDDVMCCMAAIGVTQQGQIEPIAINYCLSRGQEAWQDLAADLKRRGFDKKPEASAIEGAPEFKQVLDQLLAPEYFAVVDLVQPATVVNSFQ